MGRNLSQTERSEIKGLTRKVCIRVKVSYRDAFSPLRQYANFGYWVQSNGFGFLPKYNDSGVEVNQSQNPN